MRGRNVNYKTWEEIREELPAVIKSMEPGITSWFDLAQYFDQDKTFGLVLGYDPEGELAIKLAYEPNDSYCHEYDMDWLYPVTDDEGTCWDTEMRISKEDADRPEFLDHIIEWFKEQWFKMYVFFSAKLYLKEIAMSYEPTPIDTTDVELPEEINALTEN